MIFLLIRWKSNCTWIMFLWNMLYGISLPKFKIFKLFATRYGSRHIHLPVYWDLYVHAVHSVFFTDNMILHQLRYVACTGDRFVSKTSKFCVSMCTEGISEGFVLRRPYNLQTNAQHSQKWNMLLASYFGYHLQ